MKSTNVPKGIERKIGVSMAIPNNPYFFAVLTAIFFLKLDFLSDFSYVFEEIIYGIISE